MIDDGEDDDKDLKKLLNLKKGGRILWYFLLSTEFQSMKISSVHYFKLKLRYIQTLCLITL